MYIKFNLGNVSIIPCHRKYNPSEDKKAVFGGFTTEARLTLGHGNVLTERTQIEIKKILFLSIQFLFSIFVRTVNNIIIIVIIIISIIIIIIIIVVVVVVVVIVIVHVRVIVVVFVVATVIVIVIVVVVDVVVIVIVIVDQKCLTCLGLKIAARKCMKNISKVKEFQFQITELKITRFNSMQQIYIFF